MDTQFFYKGNYIYECKSSPTKNGGYCDTSYLNSSIKKLRALWKAGKIPSGYRYIFPINYIDDKAKVAIRDLQHDYPGVDIRYYECDSVQNLIFSLEKVGDIPSLVLYLKEVRGK